MLGGQMRTLPKSKGVITRDFWNVYHKNVIVMSFSWFDNQFTKGEEMCISDKASQIPYHQG